MNPPKSPIASHGPLLDAVRGLRWPAARRVPGGLPGLHRSRMRGTSPEFSEYRPYRQGDDPRRVDWKLLARSDRAYIRLADDHSVLTTYLLLDASASMAFPGGSGSKWEVARSITIALGSVVHATGDPVALIVPGPRPVGLAPRTRSGTVSDLARALHDVQPGGTHPLAPMLERVPSRARAVIVSDFLGDAEQLLARSRERVASGGEVHAVHIVAREELEPVRGARLALDPENRSLRRPLSSATREAYAESFARWRAELAAGWRAAGAGYTMVVTDAPLDRVVRQVVSPRTTAPGQGAVAAGGDPSVAGVSS